MKKLVIKQPFLKRKKRSLRPIKITKFFLNKCRPEVTHNENDIEIREERELLSDLSIRRKGRGVVVTRRLIPATQRHTDKASML